MVHHDERGKLSDLSRAEARHPANEAATRATGTMKAKRMPEESERGMSLSAFFEMTMAVPRGRSAAHEPLVAQPAAGARQLGAAASLRAAVQGGRQVDGEGRSGERRGRWPVHAARTSHAELHPDVDAEVGGEEEDRASGG